MEKIITPDVDLPICSIIQKGNLLEIEFPVTTDLTGKDLSTIDLFTSGGIKCATLKGYGTIYKSGNPIILSNDGSVYTEPTPIDVTQTEPYIPTLAETQTNKISEMDSKCNHQILAGFISKAFDGVNDLPYDSDTLSQLDLNGLVAIAQMRISGYSTEILKWKNANQIKCEEWTPEQILALGLDMKRHIESNKDHYHDLKDYINSLTNIADVQAVTWDTVIA